jgi:hypothetical protein
MKILAKKTRSCAFAVLGVAKAMISTEIHTNRHGFQPATRPEQRKTSNEQPISAADFTDFRRFEPPIINYQSSIINPKASPPQSLAVYGVMPLSPDERAGPHLVLRPRLPRMIVSGRMEGG